MSTPSTQKLREILGSDVPDELLQLALTHPSSVGEGLERTLKSNQRLEFLGDAIVGASVAEHWYQTHSHLPEGELTQRKAAAVQKKTLARVAAKLELAHFIRVGRGADALIGRGRDAILADAFEALIGALFIAQGWNAARDFVLRALHDELKEIAGISQTANIKNLLQEHTQAVGLGTQLHRPDALQPPDPLLAVDVPQFSCWLRRHGGDGAPGLSHVLRGRLAVAAPLPNLQHLH